jgi:ABC-type Fe3+/spermidine/putrescine transport system ATPase subunit
LVTHPKLLLLDEPLSSLDTEVRLNLQEAIRRIQRELGITTIFVTHDLGEAMAMSDRMAILLKGSVAAIDQPEVLFHRPPCMESARFVGVNLFVEGKAHGGWLDSPLGRLRIHDAHQGRRRTFAIRPEHIRLDCEQGENTLAGTVTDCVFRGEYVEYQVNVGELSVRARMPMPAPMHAHGEQVFVRLPAEHLFEVMDGQR